MKVKTWNRQWEMQEWSWKASGRRITWPLLPLGMESQGLRWTQVFNSSARKMAFVETRNVVSIPGEAFSAIALTPVRPILFLPKGNYSYLLLQMSINYHHFPPPHSPFRKITQLPIFPLFKSTSNYTYSVFTFLPNLISLSVYSTTHFVLTSLTYAVFPALSSFPVLGRTSVPCFHKGNSIALSFPSDFTPVL